MIENAVTSLSIIVITNTLSLNPDLFIYFIFFGEMLNVMSLLLVFTKNNFLLQENKFCLVPFANSIVIREYSFFKKKK